MRWRLIESGSHGAAMNMAIDQAVYEHSMEDGRPSIRLYGWKDSAISLSAYQDATDINLEACRHHGIDIVRRMTGGRAAFHSPSDFTYCVVVPIRLFDYSIATAYRSICNSILIGLKKMGIKGKLEHSNDVLVDGRKISGNAAKMMDKGLYLQHGTVSYDSNPQLLAELFRHDFKVFEDNATSILEQKDVPRQQAYEALKEGFTKGKDVFEDKLTMQELRRAESLSLTKYKDIMLPKGTFSRRKGACSITHG